MTGKHIEIEKIKKIVENVDGWLRDDEGEFLYTTARNCSGKGVIVEIGSWKGKSTIWLGKGSKRGNRVKIYAIDPHTGSSEHRRYLGRVNTFEKFKRNIRMAKVDDVVIPIAKTSEQAAKDFSMPIEFLFIDGAHEYEFVKLDFELWSPKLVDGGVIAFHDTTGARAQEWSVGPKKVVEKYVFRSNSFRNIGIVGSTTFAQKVPRNSFEERLSNLRSLFLKNLYDLPLAKPKPVSEIAQKIIQRIM